MTAGRDVVYVVAKAPRAWQSKTRLCPPLRPEQAAALAAAFLRDTVALASRAGPDVRLICRDAAERAALLPYATSPTPATSATPATSVTSAGVSATVHVQTGTGLGDALESAFTQGLADGYRAVGVLGMDTPALPPAVLAEAFARLRAIPQAGGGQPADVALGPSLDGGYYLLAARRLHPRLFRDMVWSTSEVARETLGRCATLGLRTHLVATWDDVDDAASLERLRGFLAGAPAEVAPHTRAALDALVVGPHVHATPTPLAGESAPRSASRTAPHGGPQATMASASPMPGSEEDRP